MVIRLPLHFFYLFVFSLQRESSSLYAGTLNTFYRQLSFFPLYFCLLYILICTMYRGETERDYIGKLQVNEKKNEKDEPGDLIIVVRARVMYVHTTTMLHATIITI